MTTLSSKIDGIQIWTYDFARQPYGQDTPQALSYTTVNAQGNGVKPVTQNPTKYTDQFVNKFKCIFDVNHSSNGQQLFIHGAHWIAGDPIDQRINATQYTSAREPNPVQFAEDTYLYTNTTVTADDRKKPFTTKTTGIKIVYQTGLLNSNRGYCVVIFEVANGYKIPVGSTITANPTVQSMSSGNYVKGTPETYPVAYEIPAGVYEIVLTDNAISGWNYCDIDFATVPDTPTTTPTTPTNITIPILQDLTHATSNISGVSIDRKLNSIVLTADNGYNFQSDIQILFYSGGKVLSIYNVKGNNQSSLTIPLNTTKENTITDNMDDILITGVGTDVNSHTGYEHNYLITDPELNAFSKDHIWSMAHDDEGEEIYNVSHYINRIIELPFIVNTVTTINNISVGNEQSHVSSHEAKSSFVTLDLGVINVPAKYNNGYDYQNRTVKLYTPFVNPITINNENAIDKTIQIIYKVDISNGDLTVNLYNNNVLFFTGASNIASQLPFLNNVKDTIINQDNHFNDNDIRKPYIVVTRETPILNNDYYPTIERGLIKDYNGNMKARLMNNVKIPNSELSQLNNLLESGVQYVKNN